MKIKFEHIYAGFRTEESTPARVAMNGWRYLLKYLFKKRNYTAAELEWVEQCKENAETISQPATGTTELNIGLAGDLMWIRNEKRHEISPELVDRMKKADYWIANLETPLSADRPVNSPYPDLLRYSASPLLLTKFNEGYRNLFGILSLANNHILDYGYRGVRLTREVLDREGILYAGTEGNFIIKESNGVTVGFYASTYGVNFHEKSKIRGVTVTGEHAGFIEKARRVIHSMDESGCDLKIFSLHWGHEFEFIPTPAQRQLARELVNAGANIILGHHPHVIQPVEVLYTGGYEKRLPCGIHHSFLIPGGKPGKALVAYSLGNFMSGMVTRECRQGLALIISVFRHGNSIDWEISGRFFTANSTNSLSVGVNQRR